MRSLALVALAAILALPSSAQTVSPAIEFALELGGDEVSELLFEDGDTQTQTAGQGGTIAGGVLVRPSAGSPLGARATLGYKFLLNASSNANTRITRFPLELVASYTFGPNIEIGAGPVAHLGTKLHGDGFVEDVSFDPAVGVTVEAGLTWAALTYTAIRYTAEDGTEYDASNVGLSLRYVF